MGSLLRFPSLHDISHHREECSAVQTWSCQRQKCEYTNLHTLIHPFVHSFIHPSTCSYIFFPYGQVHAVLSSFLTVLFWHSAYQMHTKCQCSSPATLTSVTCATQVHKHMSAWLQLVQPTHSILSCLMHMLTHRGAVLHFRSDLIQCKYQQCVLSILT